MPRIQRLLCDVFRVDTNYSLFVAGIIAGIPATLLLNLVTFDVSELTYPWVYGGVYLVTFAASLLSCVAMFRFAVRHIEVRGMAARDANKNCGTEEEFENALVLAVGRAYKERLRPIVRMLLWCTGITVLGVFALFYIVNL